MTTYKFNGQTLPYTGNLPLPGLIEFLKQFGSIWYGPVTHQVFNQRLHNRVVNLIASLVDIDDIVENQTYKVDKIGFNLDFIAQARTIEKWHFPGIMYNLDDWPAGNTRLTDTGLSTPGARESFKVLCPAQKTKPDFLDNPEHIETDEQFNRLLELDNWYNPELMPQVFFDVHPGPRLEFALRESDLYKKHRDRKEDRMSQYVEWFQKYKNNRRIGIYTDYPEKIINTYSFWQPEILGPSTGAVLPERPASLDAITKKTRWPDHLDHILYVNTSDQLDLGQLLIWLDLTHGQFADFDWRFSLVRRGAEHVTRFISVVDFESLLK
jgi:hypothetical protein